MTEHIEDFYLTLVSMENLWPVALQLHLDQRSGRRARPKDHSVRSTSAVVAPIGDISGRLLPMGHTLWPFERTESAP